MSSQFHNRLVGTVVLMALGVIFLPDILDGKKERQQEQFTEIPLRPQVAAATSPELDSVVLDEPDSAAAMLANTAAKAPPTTLDVSPADTSERSVTPTENSVPKNVQPQPKAVEKPQTAAQVSWTIQLGAFSNAANVKALVQRLRKNGYAAYTLPQKPVEGKLTRVFVGPEVSLERLKTQQQKVETLTKLKGKIVHFNPLEN
ncbi:SPOR domain-containing protein [Shewanella sp. YIC-542]|uniref:SPOR domain-containing protein n=1 Tax=Shewanella mytili TaxID=3377111 RepID=UPI00398EBABC